MIVILGKYEDDGRKNEYVKIDPWDTWDMYTSLGLIALPMLKQLREQKHGSPVVDLEDVPPELQLHGIPQYETHQLDMFSSEEGEKRKEEAMHTRWDWVLDEIIFAFESIVGENQDWEDKYSSGNFDVYFEKVPGNDEFSEMKYGRNHTFEVDWEGRLVEGNRIQNGFRLFGKYYQALWD